MSLLLTCKLDLNIYFYHDTVQSQTSLLLVKCRIHLTYLTVLTFEAIFHMMAAMMELKTVLFGVLLLYAAAKEVEAQDPPTAFGRSVHINKMNLFGELEETGAKIFNDLPESCFVNSPSKATVKKSVSYANTKSIYSYITSTTGLSASMGRDFTLGFTLDTVSKCVAASNRTVSGNSLLTMASQSMTRVDQGCLYDQQLSDEILKDLNTLPTGLTKPWDRNTWEAYNTFLEKYGSHVMTAVTFGSSINQMSWADTSKKYSQRDFQVKSCVFLGLGEKAEVEQCTDVTEKEIEETKDLEMVDTITITGGTPETRKKLLSDRSSSMIEQFMNEATTSPSHIQYSYKPLWEILQARFIGQASDNFVRAMNFEFYYLGFLNYGCNYLTAADQDLQRFDYTSDSTPATPQYECTLAPEGCHHDDDCNYQLGPRCACIGDSCVRYYYDTILDTGDVKPRASTNEAAKWGWHGCDWRTWGGHCDCKHESNVRLKVWTIEDKSILYAAHKAMLKQAAAAGKQEL